MPKKKYIFDERKSSFRRAHPGADKPGAFMAGRGSTVYKAVLKEYKIKDLLYNKNEPIGREALGALNREVARDRKRKKAKKTAPVKTFHTFKK